MYTQVALLRPTRGNAFLTYSIPENFPENIKKGDIIEVPFGNHRELAVVFSVFEDPPEFKTKNIGKCLHHEFFSEQFLEYIQKISEFFFCSPSFFLAKAVTMEEKNTLSSPPQEVYIEAENFPEISHIKGKKQQELAQFFLNNPEKISLKKLKNLFSSAVLKSVEDKCYIKKTSEIQYQNRIFLEKDIFEKFPKTAVVEKKFPEIFPISTHPYIFLGSNFSEKNAILTRVIQNILAEQKQVLFIFPDQISLEQAYNKFLEIFPKKFLEKYSSATTKKQKKILSWKLSSGYTKMVLASKNALFFPFQNLGGIILHDYHSELYITQSFPYTHAKDIAKIRAHSEHIPLFFSATTGNIEEVFESAEKNFPLIEFSGNQQKKSVFCADMNLERMNGNMSSLSAILEEKITEKLLNNQQSLLFLNRKGMFTSLLCSECQWSPTSPLSGNKLGVFRQKDGKKILRCTQSKYHENFPEKCPHCKKNTLIEIGKGTQEVEELIRKKFPQARVFRADKDSLSNNTKVKNFLERVEKNEVDIIIGTQIIIQAFPLKNVSLVANILTENDILFPSFAAEEKGFIRNMKLFDLLGKTQNPEIILQTFCPKNPFIQKICTQNFKSFFQSEISGRKALQYPPFSHALQIIAHEKKQENLEKKMEEIQKSIHEYCQNKFPVHISFHPHRQLYTAKILCFTPVPEKIWNKISGKNITLHRYEY